jgi:hypothetical protein
MNRSRWCLLIGMLVRSCAAGCTKRVAEGDTVTHSFAWWVPVSVFVGGLVAAPAGWSILRKSNRWGWGLLILSPVAVLVFFPGLLTDNLTIDAKQLSLKTDFWFMPTRHELRFDDVANSDLTAQKRRTRRGSRTSYTLECRLKSGATQTVPVGDLMKAALPDVVDRLRSRGTPFTDRSST